MSGEALLRLRDAGDCEYDLVALGEVMLRLDPGERRIRSARTFDVSEGGGEYNVARALSSTFDRRTAVVTALVDNEVGHLVEGLVRAGGVDTAHVQWVGFDGLGRAARNGLNFTERGFGVRPPLGVSDRGHAAASLLKPGDVDWESLFGTAGVRWFHTGGVFAGLSATSRALMSEAMESARTHGCVVSYDLNYRESIWGACGGLEAARRVNAAALTRADVVFGSPQEVAQTLGLASRPEADAAEVAAQFTDALPRLRVLAGTSRVVHSATRQRWGGAAWSPGSGLVAGPDYGEVEVLDRVGSGDAFAAGLLDALLRGGDLQTSLRTGLAAAALTMTTPGDSLDASAAEVSALAAGKTGFLR